MQTPSAKESGGSLSATDSGSRRIRRVWMGVIGLTVLAVTGAGLYLKQRQDKTTLTQALEHFPRALSQVPLPSGPEPPVERFHKACALLAQRMNVPAATMEDTLAERARAIDSDDEKHRHASSLEQKAARLVALYLSKEPENPETLKSRQTNGLLLSEDGCLQESEAELRAVLAYRRAVIGRDHRNTIRNQKVLAGALVRQKRFDEAETESREALTDAERTAGPDHPDTIETRLTLAAIMRAQRKFEEEEALRRAVLSSWERTAKPNEYEFAAAHLALLKCLITRGKKEEGLAHATKVMEFYKSKIPAKPNPKDDLTKLYRSTIVGLEKLVKELQSLP